MLLQLLRLSQLYGSVFQIAPVLPPGNSVADRGPIVSVPSQMASSSVFRPVCAIAAPTQASMMACASSTVAKASGSESASASARAATTASQIQSQSVGQPRNSSAVAPANQNQLQNSSSCVPVSQTVSLSAGRIQNASQSQSVFEFECTCTCYFCRSLVYFLCCCDREPCDVYHQLDSR